MRKLFLLLLTVLVLLGIAGTPHAATWLHLDYSPQRFDMDIRFCAVEAQEEFRYLEGLSPRWNVARLESLFENCMGRRGWTKS